jgi:hypothetical protein
MPPEKSVTVSMDLHVARELMLAPKRIERLVDILKKAIVDSVYSDAPSTAAKLVADLEQSYETWMALDDVASYIEDKLDKEEES